MLYGVAVTPTNPDSPVTNKVSSNDWANLISLCTSNYLTQPLTT